MRKSIAAMFALCLGLPSAAQAIEDYTGPFTTKVLFTMCSRPDRASHEKCDMYLQGLMYGLNVSRSMQGKLDVCLPDMTTEAARARLVQFIDATTGGKPETNRDSGDWIAFLSLASGNLCKK